jgi:dihydrofolate reductase
MRLVMIAAIAANGVIGADGEMPWHYPADLDHFRETTTGHPVIVGRVTFEAIRERLGGPLPDRDTVVLTSDPARFDGDVTAVDSREAAIEAAAATGATTAYVAGGASVYETFLPVADELLLTELDESVAGDTTFPAVAWDRWVETEREADDAFDIVRYHRVETLARGERE